MFKDAKVEDRVWSPILGWGRIWRIESDALWVDNGKGITSFNIDGKYWKESVAPSLFWDEVKIEPPPRPKRKVKKSNTVYLVPLKYGVSSFSSKDIAEGVAKSCYAVSPIVSFTYEWEEEK